jgi:type III restriction enzyme
VPSIAIKEGTYKTLEITKEHFKGEFDNINYDYFIYDSSNLEQVRDFATSSEIRIMVINIDAFRKSFVDTTKHTSANIIHRNNDRLNGEKPIDFIASTNPIVIIDEPQSVDNTDKAKEAIEKLNPLCRLRYSATHIEKFNLMYKLDSIDAYEQKLVKQIEVANVRIDDSFNNAYIKLLSVKANPRSAKIEMDINQKGTTTRKEITVKDGSDLYALSNGRDVYSGYTINDIYIEKGNEYIEFSNHESIGIGESIGDMDDDSIKQLQIKKTIEEHLDKELRLTSKNIKVLSLFFIDRVDNYRAYDEEGNPKKGKYALWFEEAYKEIIKKRKYNTLFEDVDITTEAEKIHDGYFSSDKKGKLKDSSLTTKGELRANKDDEDTFSLIMKDKEKLLSFSSKLRFIFSHSALKEGWDNPNVFQICTLNETKSVMKKRQEIGRGLRICVNQDGERVYGFDVNTLTVMANESYEAFAKSLQEEIEKEEGIRFDGKQLPVKNANDKERVSLKKEILLSDDFKELWEQVKYKTTYRVDFNIDILVDECAKKIANELTIGKIKYLYSKAKNKITKVGVEIDTTSIKEQFSDVEIIDYKLPDIITYLQNETNLTRKNIVDILIKSGKLESFKNNPQKFIDGAIKIIKKTMSIFIVDGIKYQKIGNDSYYAQKCFEEQELYGYLSKNMIENRDNKSIYNYTIYDSDVEKGFAKSFNENDNVKLFTKLPSWFKINTPLGGYNPDWAVLIEKDNEEKLYFVVESKGSLFTDDLRDTEEAKIKCATEHFKEISQEVKFIQSNNFEHMREFI